MTSAVFPLAYAAACAFVAFSAFRCMHFGLRKRHRSVDRTGLRTLHPELLDDNGLITKEALLVVRFGGLDDTSLSVSS